MPDRRTADLSREMIEFVTAATEGLARRFLMPEGDLPATVAGYPSYDRTDSALMRLYGRLLQAGVRDVGGLDLAEQITRLLANVGSGYKTWWSLFIADTLEMTHPTAEGHPLLEGLTDRQRQAVIEATDSTSVVDVPNEQLIGHPNNYWMVMARLEGARLRLGLTDDTTIRDLSLRKTRRLLLENPAGYMDDSHLGDGRYDVYTMHALIAAEPLLEEIPPETRRNVLAAHERLLLATARPDGWSVAWGRSSEMAITSVMELGAILLAHGCKGSAQRVAGLVANAFDRFCEHSWADDAIARHRRGMTHWYRGPGRLLEYSVDALESIAATARTLAQAETDIACTSDPAELFPFRDEWIEFDSRGIGAWCFRNEHWDLQLPVVDGYTSDYAAFPIARDVLEQPVDCPLACGVPNLFLGRKRYLPLRRPADVTARAGELTWTTTQFTHYEDFDWWKPVDDVPGRRSVTLRMDGDALVGEERWTFEELPDRLGFWIPEVNVPLEVTYECNVACREATVAVDGMPDWRSYWGPIRRLHQIDIDPAAEVKLIWRVRKKS